MTHAVNRMPDPAHGTPRTEVHHRIPYFLIFVALVVLTVVTVAVATKRFESEAVNVLLALLIASVKATLVAMFFMHLKFEGKLIYFIAIVPLFLCVLLVVALIPDIINGHLYTNPAPSFLQSYGAPHLHP